MKNVCSYASVIGKNALDVDSAIDAGLAKNKKGNEAIQCAAIAVLIHAEKCGDYTKANRLVNEAEGINSVGLVEFFKQFGGFTVSEGGEGFDGWKGKEYIRDNFQDAKATGWWTLKPQNPWKGFNFEAELQKLTVRADKALKKRQSLLEEGKEDEAAKVEINVDTLQAARALVKAA